MSQKDKQKSGRLAGRTIIVTGSSQGIGAAYAEAAAREGANLALCDLQAPDTTANRIAGLGNAVFAKACDVTDREAVVSFIKDVIERLGSVHGLINNAALFASLRPKPLEMIEPSEFTRVLDVNVRGTFECIRAVLPAMRQQAYGKIVNISSGTVLKGVPLLAHYVASKGAIVALTRSVAREIGPHGIRVNCLAPGFTLSEGVQTNEGYPQAFHALALQSRCLSRDQLPADLTGAACFLLSPESDFMTGQTLVVDGGSAMN